MPAKRSASDLADEFIALWERFCPELPKPEAEYKFDPGRRYRADWAWPRHYLLLEVDGGQYASGGGRHNRDNDRWKLNEAAALGYRVIHVTPQMLRDDPLRVCREVAFSLGYSFDHDCRCELAEFEQEAGTLPVKKSKTSGKRKVA